MSANTKYGFCRGECQKWVPRDEMLSINVSVYDASNEETRIPMRFCPSCHKKMQSQLDEMRWDNVLHTEAEICANEDLAAASDLEYDGSPEAQQAAEEAKERVEEPVPLPSKRDRAVRVEDDSEAAMRRRGKQVDVTY